MRKLTAMMLAGALSLSVLSPTALAHDHKGKGHEKRPKYEEDFKDWQRDFWANESLARMITRGVIKGNGDQTIASNRPVTRLEAAIMLSRLLELEPPEIPYGEFKVKASWGEMEIENEKNEFEIKIKTRDGEFTFKDGKDVPQWGRDAILIGLREGFLIFDGASLSPMKPLNRLEAAMMMVKAAGLDAEAQSRAGADLEFKDAKKIPERLRGYIALAVENGFVNGYEDGTFRPEQILTRAEWAALLDRLDRRNGPAVTADGRQIKATVTEVDADSSPSISVTTPVYPGGVTYPVDDTAVFYKNGKEITIADIQEHDQVIINLDGEREIILLTVANLVRQVSGKVEHFTTPADTESGEITVDVKGTDATFTLTDETRVLLAGREASLDDLREGDLVTLKVEGSRVTQIAIKVEPVTVTGTLEAIDFGDDVTLPTLEVKGEGNTTTTYSVADHASIKAVNGSEITLADLNPGDLLTLRVERDLVTAIQVKPTPVRTVTGTLEEIDFGSDDTLPTVTIKGEGDSSTTYSVADHASIKGANGAAISLDDLNLGDQLTLKVERNLVTAIQVKPAPIRILSGKVESFVSPTETQSGEITVNYRGSADTYTVTSDTEVLLAGREASFEDVREGDLVTLKLEGSRVTQIAIKVEAFLVTGALEEINFDGDLPTLQIKGANNSRTTYTVAENVTVKAANGAAISLEELNPGDQLTLKVERNLVIAIQVKR